MMARTKASRSRRLAAVALGDHGTAERARHGELAPRDTMIPGVTGKRVKHECRLDWYWDKSSIVDRQHQAGIRFRRDWQAATAGQTLVGNYGLRVPGRHEFTDSQLAARRRIAKVSALLGKELAEVLVDVCCFDNWASGRLPKLREGLTMLADQYGIERERGA
jgi:hypothetical protein